MFDATPQVAVPPRKRGPEPFFQGEKLRKLIAYLNEPGSTIQGAAEKFGCSDSTVEKTLARIRRATNGNAPASDTGAGLDSAEAGA